MPKWEDNAVRTGMPPPVNNHEGEPGRAKARERGSRNVWVSSQRNLVNRFCCGEIKLPPHWLMCDRPVVI